MLIGGPAMCNRSRAAKAHPHVGLFVPRLEGAGGSGVDPGPGYTRVPGSWAFLAVLGAHRRLWTLVPCDHS